MSGYLTDDEIDGMFDDDEMIAAAPMQSMEAEPMVAAPEPVPLYPLSLAQSPVESPGGVVGVVTKKLGGVPVWAWGLIGLGVGGTGYFFWRSRNAVKPNGSDEDDAEPSLGDSVSANGHGAWEPSRSGFASQLEKYFTRKGQAQHVVVWHDAEEAKRKGGLKFVSPLINVQVKGGAVKVDSALTRFCRREGLNPQQHQDGSIGLYPHSSKRGKEWEEYIDALRDEGQTV